MNHATRTGAALAVAVVLAAAATPWALADAGTPTDTTPAPVVTTPDPSATVPAPEPAPAPVEVVPKPDPGPVKVVSKPKPQVVHPVYRAPATPAVVVQPSVTPAPATVAKPRVTPKHVATQRKHLVKPKPAQVTRPQSKPTQKPKPVATELTTISTSAGTSGGWARSAWAKILLAALSFVLLVYVVFATRRARRSSGVATAPEVGLVSANGSDRALHDEELALLELDLETQAERADQLAAELAPFRTGTEAIPESLLSAEKTANELRDTAEATLLKARRLADRIVEEAARRRTRLEARNAALKLEVQAQAERADELEAELARFHARESLLRETANELRGSAEAATTLGPLLEHTPGENGNR
jgi:hypothetical protein